MLENTGLEVLFYALAVFLLLLLFNALLPLQKAGETPEEYARDEPLFP